ncbi:MAG: hypothetical protein JSV86_09160 [Gemmatimonadota bacterium]|nr:MAG: hypothetical protein JSV86_09160 [Gemmatimonadota bacterium]
MTVGGCTPCRPSLRKSGPVCVDRHGLQELEISRDAYTVYVRPELVAEIAFDAVQTSPKYPGGVTLRFARLKRYRPDKRAAEADTIETVRAICDPPDLSSPRRRA